MPEWLSNMLDQFKELPPARQVTLVATAAGSLAFFLWLASGTQESDYRLLYRGLEDAEIATVTEALTTERVDWRLEEGGSAIYVPAAMIHEARIRVAARGLPSGTSPGFEIFDRGSFGVTDFVQKVNYRRALQGELARSVEEVDAVERARVQIAVPERSVFVRKEQKEASASVVVQLRPGRDLDDGQVDSIVHLVASSVDGLRTDRVTLVDDRGRLLSPHGGGGGRRGSSAGLARQAKLEGQLEQQIESILERTVGIGRVEARVAAELDWTQRESTEEAFDPDSQVARSEQRTTDAANETAPQNGGVVGVVANTPEGGAAGDAQARQTNSSRSSETLNYEISKVVRPQVDPVGAIKRLSIAVLVDGQPATAEESGEGAPGWKPWSDEQLEEFERLAALAVGFDRERGDQISVVNAPFETIALPEDEGLLTPELLVLLTTLLHGVAFLVGLILFAKLMVKPLADAIRPDHVPVALPEPTNEELTPREVRGLADRDMIPGLLEENTEMTLQEQVDMLAEARSDDSVKTIRGWLAG